MKTDHKLIHLLTLVVCGWTLAAGAASGTWTSLAGGSWTNTANWRGGTVATGSGNSANFSTLHLTADAPVTLNGARTIGNLSFDDQSTTKHNWLLNTGAAGPLTLAGTTPTVTVSSATTTINAVLAGSAGLTKSGASKLVLGGANTYSGTTAVSAGTLTLGTVTFSSGSPLSIAASAVAESGGTLNLSVNTSSTAIDVSGTGTLRLIATGNSAAAPDHVHLCGHARKARQKAPQCTPGPQGMASACVLWCGGRGEQRPGWPCRHP